MHKLISFSLAALLFLSACDQDTEQPVEAREATRFARELESSVMEGRYRFFDSIFNEKVFFKRVTDAAGQHIDNAIIKGMKQGLARGGLGEQIMKTSRNGGRYEMVRHYEKDQKQHLIFRLFESGGGLNYHDIELVKMNGRVQAADIFVYLSGENLSGTLAALASVVTGYADKEGEGGMKLYASYLKDIKELVNENRFEKAQELFRELPEEFRKERVFQLINIQITSRLGEEAYQAALLDFETSFADDPSAQLVLIDSYILQKQFDKALKAIDVVDRTVQDPLLNYYRGLVFLHKEDYPKAIGYLERLLEKMPGFEDGFVELIAACMETKDYKKAAALVSKYKSNQSFDQEKLNVVELLYPAKASAVGL